MKYNVMLDGNIVHTGNKKSVREFRRGLAKQFGIAESIYVVAATVAQPRKDGK